MISTICTAIYAGGVVYYWESDRGFWVSVFWPVAGLREKLVAFVNRRESE